MTPSSEAGCTLACLLATASTKAVIYRRGPSKQICLILWDRTKDTFDIGQWFKGAVYPDRCDLSPDGTRLLTFMGDHGRGYGTWTCLSHPPFFTALGLWPHGGTYGGGGLFLDDRTVALQYGCREEEQSAGLRAVPLDYGPPSERRRNAIDRGLATSTGRARLTAVGSGHGWKQAWSLVTDDGTLDLPSVNWASFDTNDDLLAASGGRLTRIPSAIAARPRSWEHLVEKSHLLADFSALRFRPLAAPYPGVRSRSGHPDGVLPPGAEFEPALDRVSKDDRRRRKRSRTKEQNSR